MNVKSCFKWFFICAPLCSCTPWSPNHNFEKTVLMPRLHILLYFTRFFDNQNSPFSQKLLSQFILFLLSFFLKYVESIFAQRKWPGQEWLYSKIPSKKVLSKSKRKNSRPSESCKQSPGSCLEICILQAYISLNKFLGSLLTNEKHNF